jgi:hypothetical protein
MPSLWFNGLALGIYCPVVYIFKLPWAFDWAAVAAIFGKDRGAISDYIYGGKLIAPLAYVFILWVMAGFLGYWFGWSALMLCGQKTALDGVEHISARDFECEKPAESLWGRFVRTKFVVTWGWKPWSWFFHESFVPLFTWRAQETSPAVRVERTDRQFYWGKFVGYEKTTGGRMDAIRLKDVKRRIVTKPKSAGEPAKSEWTTITHVYMKWSHVAEMHIIGDDEYAKIDKPLSPQPPAPPTSDEPPQPLAPPTGEQMPINKREPPPRDQP